MKLLGVICLLASTGICAHPHSWVDMKSQLKIKDNTLYAIEFSWIFDEFTSAFMLEDIPASGLGQHALDKLADEVMANMSKVHYFTYLYNHKQPVKYALSKDYQMTLAGMKLQLNFTLPLSRPQKLTGDFSMTTYDPTYFVDFSYIEKQDAPNVAGLCEPRLIQANPSESDRAFAAALDQTESGGDELGEKFSQKVVWVCPS